ncbi:MAG: ribonuclease R [Lachnospiraceae bacterium]|nr:ribonuclease R [Lachnospiraceae bacterium]
MDTNDKIGRINEDIDFQDRCDVIYNLICDDLYVPMKAKELASLLNISKGERVTLHKVLDTLVERGKITCSSSGKYVKLDDVAATDKSVDKRHSNKHRDRKRKFDDESDTLVGTFIANAKGFGFVKLDDSDEEIFIGKKKTLDAFNGDKVGVRIYSTSHGDKREGVIVNIISHETTNVVGTYEKCNNFGFVICDDIKIGMDIFIPQGKDMHAVTGHKVVAHITKYAKNGSKPEGVITEIIGHKNDPGVDILSMIKAFNVPTDFPTKVLNQASKVAKPVSEADMQGREDFRDVLMVTIDGEDAKDLDDAVSVSYDGTNYELGVYIADVANYVQDGSALDKEAYKRGTSVYLIDRVIPMLPHTLSNGICSLNQGEDRLAMCCIMTINGKGDIIDYRICEGVVNVNYRMTYSDVSAILKGDEELSEKYSEVSPMFLHMQSLSAILRTKRKKRGGIDFDISETKFELDDKGNIVDIKPYVRDVSSMIIEDFMLAANETVAEEFFWKDSTFLYRTHSEPELEKVRNLKALVSKFGYILKGDSQKMHPKEFQKMLDKVKGKEEEMLISRITLRTMQQAKYSVENIGHFGLAAKYYCHFTSPIRRYPDLIVHRIIKDHLRGRYDEAKEEYLQAKMPVVANSTSKTERRAEELEREVEKLKKVQYMHQFLGREYKGIISSVTGFGIYVELYNGVDGLVHISTLRDDNYYFDENNYELVGDRTGRRFSLGREVKVMVSAVNEDARTIDFELV